jgi:hypothetical protein
MKAHGFPVAHVSSILPGEPKLQRLWRTQTPEVYYAAFGSYMDLVLRATYTGSRDADQGHLDLCPEGIVDLLKSVGLLNPDGSLPAHIRGVGR